MKLHEVPKYSHDKDALINRFLDIRKFSDALSAPLSPEDRQIQSMADASPTKWHLAHTNWFFETFILVNYLKGYKRFNEDFNYLYNSYYNGIGEQFPRAKRGLVTRPSSNEIDDYRVSVQQNLVKLLSDDTHPEVAHIASLTDLGTHHEQQHQELILTDIKHGFFQNATYPSYCPPRPNIARKAPKLEWVDFDEGLYHIGYDGDGFAFDNERPAHKKWLDKYQLASRPVTNGDYLEFINDGGYQKYDLWLSEGWFFINKMKRNHPAYWLKKNNDWHVFTLSGLLPLNLEEPVCHVNFYEAQAYAAWAGARLPTETEWEVASAPYQKTDVPEIGKFHPAIAGGNENSANGLLQMIGEVWEWTSSGYEPYPNFKTLKGVAGEYNGKFMCNQYVLKGGSCVTPKNHIRISYRNFFPTAIDWQFTGIRLARSNHQ